MPRRFGTDRTGTAFSEATKAAVWYKAAEVPGIDGRRRRKDRCGAWIEWAKYGDVVEGGAGWEIDHEHPVAHGGGDDLVNLEPLQWQNNRHKGDNWPNWTCLVKAT